MSKLLLVRHGITDHNSNRMFAGATDVELSDDGYRQVEKLRDRLANEQVDAIYSSDLKRALVTAEVIASGRDLEIITYPELRECNYGDAEGLTLKEIGQQFPEIAQAMSENSLEIDFPGGEHFKSFIARAGKFADRLNENVTEQTILIVTHGGVLRALVCSLLDLDQKYWWSFQFSNTSLSIIETRRQRKILTLLNDTSHLQDAD